MLIILTGFLLFCSVSNACDPPFEAADGGCYFHASELFVHSYEAAEEFCLNLDSQMAVVKSGDENRAVLNLLRGDIQGLRVLLGGLRNGGGLFEWIDGSLMRDGFTSWATFQPSGNGDCMGYSTDHSLLWDDFPCDNYTESGLFVGFVCEKSAGGNATTTTQLPDTTTAVPECPTDFVDLGVGCYHVSSAPLAFDDGYSYCASLNSHMAYIKTADEQQAVAAYLTDNVSPVWIWIGGYDQFEDDNYYWLDGTPFEYTSWVFDQPNGGSENGIYMNGQYEWDWGDYQYSNLHTTLCESEYV